MPLSRTARGNKNQAFASTSANTLVSNSFTPAAGALLLCLFEEATSDATPSLTMSSTFTGQGAWTVRHVFDSDGFGSMIVSAIAWSVCGASPGTGTVTATRRAGTFSMGMNCDFVEVTGQDASPERQYQTASLTASSTVPVNLSSAPLSSSFLFFASCIDGSTGVVTAPTGTTLIGSQFAIGSFCGSNVEDLSSVAQNNSFTGGNGGSRETAVVIEVAEQSGYPIPKRWGGVPFTAIGQRGRW